MRARPRRLSAAGAMLATTVPRKPPSPSPGRDPVEALNAEGVEAWRQVLGLTQADAAARIGVSRRMWQYYAKLAPSEVPLTVRLACVAVARVPGVEE
jgi:predicted DNA-binding protein (UPF0251 family)